MAKNKAAKSRSTKAQAQARTSVSSLDRAMDASDRPTWIDGMRIMFRSDLPVAILVFESHYPDQQVNLEVARLYTTVAHIERMVEVMKRNVEAYKAQLAEGSETKSK